MGGARRADRIDLVVDRAAPRKAGAASLGDALLRACEQFGIVDHRKMRLHHRRDAAARPVGARGDPRANFVSRREQRRAFFGGSAALAPDGNLRLPQPRSEERRVGKEWVSTWSIRGTPNP